MTRERRLRLIKAIEEEQNCFLITYVTTTREYLDSNMALDAVRRIFDHLENIKQPRSKNDERKSICLFIHSNGGEGTVPWRLVTLIREFTDSFKVIIPHRAFSAATLTALGANEIIMHPMGMLGPTDATVTSQFNPDGPNNQKLGINVEDVSAYLALIKEDAGIQHEDELVLAFNLLAKKIHPLALGAVKRTLSQSRMMAKKLLSLHLDEKIHSHKIDEIVDNLTSKLFFHGHPINRLEADVDIGLKNIKYPPKKLEKLIWDLYLTYEKEMLLDKPFKVALEFSALFPDLEAGNQEISDPITLNTVMIESQLRLDRYEFKYQLSGSMQKNGALEVALITKSEGWATEK